MIADNGRDYKDLPHLTSGDEEFRSKFLSWDLGNISYVDVQEYLKVKDTILVPMASFEQHGPHLPLYTDTITAVEISKRVAEMIAVLHAPPIWTGYSPQHMHEPGHGRGTITIRSTTLLNLLTIPYALMIVLVWPATKGWTPGKKMLRLRIYSDQTRPGEGLGWKVAGLRFAGYLVISFTMGIGYLLIAFTSKKQGLHDLIAKTYVGRLPG